jgi:hypothetical protein
MVVGSRDPTPAATPGTTIVTTTAAKIVATTATPHRGHAHGHGEHHDPQQKAPTLTIKIESHSSRQRARGPARPPARPRTRSARRAAPTLGSWRPLSASARACTSSRSCQAARLAFASSTPSCPLRQHAPTSPAAAGSIVASSATSSLINASASAGRRPAPSRERSPPTPRARPRSRDQGALAHRWRHFAGMSAEHLERARPKKGHPARQHLKQGSRRRRRDPRPV